MKTFLKYLGPIIVLLSVCMLGIYYYVSPTNGWLTAAACGMAAGLITHILINRYMK